MQKLQLELKNVPTDASLESYTAFGGSALTYGDAIVIESKHKNTIFFVVSKRPEGAVHVKVVNIYEK